MVKNKISFKLSNFYEKLNGATNNEIKRYIFTNNLNENINRYLNRSLIKSRVSYEDFLFSLREVKSQFSVKIENSEAQNSKLFYFI